jgi:four helix bundle protein
MKYNKFEDLPIWRLSLTLTKQIYDYTSEWMRAKDFWLRDQIRRAVVSVSSNIVEWFEKSNNNEFCRFLRIAKWSCWEVRNQIYIAQEIWYINKKHCEELQEQFNNLASQIWWLIVYLIKLKSSQKNP